MVNGNCNESSNKKTNGMDPTSREKPQWRLGAKAPQDGKEEYQIN